MPAALTLQYRDRPDLWDQKGLVVNRVQEASRVLWDQEVHKVSGVISDLKEIPEILGLRAFRVIRDLLDLKEIKGPLDPRVIQDL